MRCIHMPVSLPSSAVRSLQDALHDVPVPNASVVAEHAEHGAHQVFGELVGVVAAARKLVVQPPHLMGGGGVDRVLLLELPPLHADHEAHCARHGWAGRPGGIRCSPSFPDRSGGRS